MSIWVGIEELELSPARPPGPLPAVPISLLNAVSKFGPIEPVIVRQLGPNQFEILSNVETWLAVQRLGQREVPIEVRDGVSDREAAALVKLSSRGRDQDPMDEALSLRTRLEALGGRHARGAIQKLADLTGLSRTYISHALRLLELPGEVQDMLRDGRLHVGHAKPLVTIQEKRVLLQLARRIAADGLSVRAAEQLAREARAGQMKAADKGAAAGADPNVAQLERRVGERIGCRVNIDATGGKFVIDYAHNLDVLDGVLKRLGCVEE